MLYFSGRKEVRYHLIVNSDMVIQQVSPRQTSCLICVFFEYVVLTLV